MLSRVASKFLRAAAVLAAGAAIVAGAHAMAGQPAAKPKKKTYVIGLVAKSQNNPVFLAARTGAEDAAMELGGKYGVDIRIEWRTPIQEDAQKQAEYIEQLASAGADGIAVSCSDAKTLTMAINSAVDRGTPVVCFDSDAPESKRFAYYGTDDFACGQKVAQELARTMGNKGVVAILAGNQTAPNLQRRVAGVREGLSTHPDIKILDVYYHKETPQDAVNKLEEVQRTNPQITGWAMVGGWPLFTQNALDNVHAKVVAVDALRPQLPYVKNGQVQVLLGQKVYEWGYESVGLIMAKLIENKTPSEPIIKATLVPVTGENADEYAKNWSRWLGEDRKK